MGKFLLRLSFPIFVGAHMDDTGFILYEFPCSEKIRMYMRLEMLFNRFEWFLKAESPYAHQAALGALFDLSDVSARSDLRAELLQELERHRLSLVRLRGKSGVDQSKLEETLAEIDDAFRTTSRSVGRSGQSIRENEWLQLVRTRQSIPGGTCEFDMPMLHYWLSMPAAKRRAELADWFGSMLPIRQAVMLVLRLIRGAMEETRVSAPSGTYQLPMSRKTYALARIWLPIDSTLVPEVSANKYMLWVRFSRPDERRRLHPAHESVTFDLGLCG